MSTKGLDARRIIDLLRAKESLNVAGALLGPDYHVRIQDLVCMVNNDLACLGADPKRTEWDYRRAQGNTENRT